MPGSTDCNGCEKPHTYYVQKPSTQTVYVQKPENEHTGIPVYIDRPRPQTVLVTQTSGCHNSNTCGSKVPDTEHTGIPIYVDRPPPQKQTVVVTQTQTNTKCHNSNTCGSSQYVTGNDVIEKGFLTFDALISKGLLIIYLIQFQKTFICGGKCIIVLRFLRFRWCNPGCIDGRIKLLYRINGRWWIL